MTTELRQFREDAQGAVAAVNGLLGGIGGLVLPVLGATTAMALLGNAISFIGGLVGAHGAVRDGIARLTGVLERFLEPLSQAVGRGMVEFAEWFEAWLGENQGAVDAFWDVFLGRMDEAGNRSGGLASQLGSNFSVVFGSVGDFLRGVFQAFAGIGDLLRGDFSAALEHGYAQLDAWINPLRRIQGWFDGILGRAERFFGFERPGWLGPLGDEGLIGPIAPPGAVPEAPDMPARSGAAGRAPAGRGSYGRATGMVNNYVTNNFLDASAAQRQSITLGAMDNPRVWARANGAA